MPAASSLCGASPWCIREPFMGSPQPCLKRPPFLATWPHLMPCYPGAGWAAR